jgi:hypothetical protein
MQRPQEALRHRERLREHSGKQAALARVHALLGDPGRARALLQSLEAARARAPSSVAPEALAHVYVALKQPERALALLEEGFAERSPGLCWLKVDPRFDDLRTEPRFTDLLTRLGLSP